MDTKDQEGFESVSERNNVRSTGSEQEQIQNPWPHLNDYVAFKSRLGEKLIYECKLCLPKLSTIKAHVSSLNNLKQHMKRTHASKYVQFAEKVKAGSTRGKKKNNSQPPPCALVCSDVDSISSSNLFSLSSANKRLRQQIILLIYYLFIFS